MVMQKREDHAERGARLSSFARRHLLRFFLPAAKTSHASPRPIPAWQAWAFVAWCGTVGACYLAAMLGRF